MQLDYMVTRLYGNLIIWISKKGLLQNIVILQYMAAISMIFLHKVHDFASEEARSSISLTSFDILIHSLSNILTDFLNSVFY